MKNEKLAALLDMRAKRQKFCMEDEAGNFVYLDAGVAGVVRQVEDCIITQLFGEDFSPEDEKRYETLTHLRFKASSSPKQKRNKQSDN